MIVKKGEWMGMKIIITMNKLKLDIPENIIIKLILL